MGYFTETMALFEFKGDAESAYSHRRHMEQGTGRHGGLGKEYSNAAKRAVNSNQHDASTEKAKAEFPWAPDRDGNGNDIIKDKDRGGSAKERMKNYSKERIQGANATHKYCDNIRSSSKSLRKRLSEAFDSVIL